MDLSTAEVVAPVLETLLEVDGSLERTVSYISFKGVSFEYASWNRPSLYGHVTLQGGMYLKDAYKLAVPGLPEKAELETKPGSNVREQLCKLEEPGKLTFQDVLLNIWEPQGWIMNGR